MATATFQEQGHRYEVDGIAIPSVTQVLTLAGISDVSGIPAHILDRASAIGTAVHTATELLDQDDLELESLDPQIVGYVTAYQLFKQEHNFRADRIEERGVAEYAGRNYGFCVDRIGAFVDAEGFERSVLLDIKTSSKPQASWAIQTMAYAMGAKHYGERLAVNVAKDGSYKLIWHEDESDEDVWIGALQVAHWKLAHGTKLK